MDKIVPDLVALVVLIAFLTYFIVRARKSESLQREAVERGRQTAPQIEESITMQKEGRTDQKRGIEMQQEALVEARRTNQLLLEIASALKSRNEKT